MAQYSIPSTRTKSCMGGWVKSVFVALFLFERCMSLTFLSKFLVHLGCYMRKEAQSQIAEHSIGELN